MISVLAVITARGGSKGVPGKNIAPLCGKPLLAYTIECAKAAAIKGQLVVSTDSPEIRKVAENMGVRVIERPAEISGDTASSESALLHALDTVEKEGFHPDAVMTLQPTSPLRRSGTMQAFTKRFEEIQATYDAMISLHADRTYFWQHIEKDLFKPLFPNASRRRQGREPLYVENSAFYITSTAALRSTNSVLGKNTAGFIIDADEAIDINEPLDFVLAATVLKQRLNEKN